MRQVLGARRGKAPVHRPACFRGERRERAHGRFALCTGFVVRAPELDAPSRPPTNFFFFFAFCGTRRVTWSVPASLDWTKGLSVLFTVVRHKLTFHRLQKCCHSFGIRYPLFVNLINPLGFLRQGFAREQTQVYTSYFSFDSIVKHGSLASVSTPPSLSFTLSLTSLSGTGFFVLHPKVLSHKYAFTRNFPRSP